MKRYAPFWIFVLIVIAANFMLYRHFTQKTLQMKETSIENPVQDVDYSRENPITRAVKEVEVAVVSVNVLKTRIVRRYNNPFQNPFFGYFDIPYRQDVQSIGTGLIIDERGYIVTNGHVVEGATKISVILNDGRNLEAELIGLDSVHDVAVVKISGENLPVARLGDSESLIIGEWSIAVGNPYAYLIKDSRPSVSVGVISAVERNFAGIGEGKIYKRMIQTDAAINPGNSGGPLVNIEGEVIGLNTFIFSETGESVGIGFAIPIDRVKKIARELVRYGKIRDRHFGFAVEDLNAMIASRFHLPDLNGVIVVGVEKNGPAERAGLKLNDVIQEINDYRIKGFDDVALAVSDLAIGEEIKLKVWRDGETKTFSWITEEL